MKSILFVSFLLSSVVAMAEQPLMTPVRTSNEIEGSCRIKAKEIAAETYRSCVADQKNAQIEQIKKDYQAKLQALKAHYEAELKKMSGSKAKASLDENTEAAPAVTPEKSEKKPEVPAINSATTKTPSKKSVKTVAAKKAGKKSAAVAAAPVTEMTVQLKPAPVSPAVDESVMDIPEPMPVETVIPAESSI